MPNAWWKAVKFLQWVTPPLWACVLVFQSRESLYVLSIKFVLIFITSVGYIYCTSPWMEVLGWIKSGISWLTRLFLFILCEASGDSRTTFARRRRGCKGEMPFDVPLFLRGMELVMEWIHSNRQVKPASSRSWSVEGIWRDLKQWDYALTYPFSFPTALLISLRWSLECYYHADKSCADYVKDKHIALFNAFFFYHCFRMSSELGGAYQGQGECYAFKIT